PRSPHFRAQLGGVFANMAPLLEEHDPQRASDFYRRAILHQQHAVERSPSILDFRLWLSSSYVKFARWLRRQGESDAAGRLAKWRRELWATDPERLYRVAIEFAETAAIATETDQKETWSREAAQTWRTAVELGLKDAASKRNDDAFAILRDNPRIDFVDAS
ncbi:MAG: hypothetical protein AAFX06_31505, partial [Planctomycetota bacterium]